MSDKTETVRKLLDERGIEYTTDDGDPYLSVTQWRASKLLMTLFEHDCGMHTYTIRVAGGQELTSEEAVDMTLAKTAKRIVVSNGEYGYSRCSLCDCTVGRFDKYCKTCGAKLENA